MNSLGKITSRSAAVVARTTLARRVPTQQVLNRGICGGYWYGRHWDHNRHRNFQQFWNNIQQSFENISKEGLKDGETFLYTRSNVQDKEGLYKIIVEMPGVAKEGVKVEVVDDCLIVEGKKGEKESYFTKYDISQDKVEPEQIKAKLENGILEITLPKSAGKRVAVNVE